MKKQIFFKVWRSFEELEMEKFLFTFNHYFSGTKNPFTLKIIIRLFCLTMAAFFRLLQRQQQRFVARSFSRKRNAFFVQFGVVINADLLK